jgi:hypothetical protein
LVLHGRDRQTAQHVGNILADTWDDKLLLLHRRRQEIAAAADYATAMNRMGGGGGAPLRDMSGAVMADLRNMQVGVRRGMGPAGAGSNSLKILAGGCN